MNDTSVPILEIDSTEAVLARLTAEWDELTPEAQKAARYVLDNPQDVGVSTVREIAEAANVKPNTVVRMARQAGFEGYEDFRAPFRDAIRAGTVDLGDRARWLQEIAKSGDLGGLYADMVGAALKNVQDSFANLSVDQLEAAAKAIWNSRNVYTMGVGVNHTNAQNFTYLASTGMVGFHAIPKAGSTAVDDMAWADERDVLIAMTMSPYRREVVEAVNMAIAQGMTVIAISDSPASPIIRAAHHGFIISVETPQFFPS
ncbi:MAG: MurR/RpiR family transcriptional regulator, partial [Rhodobacteraceae bacterium]|nr:MurR/RpiR family transcriptional regulator [Paracoccaceae bacterium]